MKAYKTKERARKKKKLWPAIFRIYSRALKNVYNWTLPMQGEIKRM